MRLYLNYQATIAEWRKKYNVTIARTFSSYNPANITLKCAVCGKVKAHIHRHHKACDFTFAIILPDVYAKRYLEFWPEDVDKICKQCHNKYHEYIKPQQNALIYWANSRIKRDKKFEAQVEAERLRFLELYERWKCGYSTRIKQKRKRVRKKGSKKRTNNSS